MSLHKVTIFIRWSLSPIFHYLILFIAFSSCNKNQIQKHINAESFFPQKIEYLKNEKSSIPVDEIVSDSLNDKKYISVIKNAFALGFQSEPIWLRIDATNTSSSDKIILDLGNSHLDEVTLYEKGSTSPLKIGGDFIAHSKWDAFSRTIAFEINWSKNETKTFFIQTKTSSNISYTIKFFTLETFYLKENIENTILGFFYGTIFIMVFYNLFIYFLLKDSAYLLYSISIFLNLCLQAYINGITNQFLTIDSPHFHNRVGGIILCMAAIFGWIFAQQTLNLRKHNPKSNYLILTLIGITFFYVLIPLHFMPLAYVVRIGNFIAQVFVISVFSVAVLNYATGNKQASLFLLGWTTLLLGILLFSLMQNGFLAPNFITLYSHQIGSTLEAGILSFALASKINQLKEEKAKVQSDALSMLENRVRERTKVLDDSLYIIRKDLTVAKKIQQTFFSEIKTSDPRIKFETFYQSMNEVGGDFYDMTQVTPDHYRVFVADATGHGIQAALITMAIKAEYESLKIMYDHPEDLVFHLNQIFINKYNNIQTIFSCAVCDLDLKNRKLHFASAGHPDQIHIRVGEKKILPRTGRIIGMENHSEYRAIEHYLEEGDRVYLFTDGIFEQFNSNREIFGENRVYEILAENDLSSLGESIETVLQVLKKFTGDRINQDDITIIGCEIGRL